VRPPESTNPAHVARRVGRILRPAVLLVTIFQSATAFAQFDPVVTPYLHDVTRVESWSFFEPYGSGAEPAYTILGNRATLGVRVRSRRVDLDGAFQYAQLIGLPERAIGPGALGSGGFYFFAAEAPAAYQLYFKTMMARVKDVVPGLSISAGRMGYSSGEETASGDATIDELQRLRIGSRLIGDFEWSLFQRSFDGARADFDRPSWSATASLLFPTQGGYEESANPTISSVKVFAGALTAKPALIPHQQLQLFLYHYRDQRDIRARPDNTGRVPRAADVSIATLGASHVGNFESRRGNIDVVAWAAVQAGDWYGQEHRAFSAALEAGYRWCSGWRPWLRAGFLHASGDGRPSDTRHETFFQMLPSVNRYSASAAYAQMNLRDTFVQFSLQPHRRIRTEIDVHDLRLANAADRWYHGSGATSRTGTFFGFSGRPSTGATALATSIEGTIDVTLKRPWSMRAYLGSMTGRDVVRRLFQGHRLLFFSLENILSF
jgi:hypothetical protein